MSMTEMEHIKELEILNNDKAEEEEEEEMTEKDYFNMKADLDYDQMVDDSLTD